MYFYVNKALYVLFGCAICVAHSLALVQARPRHVKVEFRLADTTPGPGLTEVRVPDTGQKLYLHKGAIITNNDIIEATAGEDPSILRHYPVTVVFHETRR